MKNIYMRHKREKDRFLVCNENYSPLYEEHIRSPMPYTKSFYTDFTKGYMGVYSSKQGPTLFINNDKYLFTDPSWNITIKRNGKSRHICFSGLREQDLAFEAQAFPTDECDPWSEEEFDDFFVWLESHRSNQELIKIWTD